MSTASVLSQITAAETSYVPAVIAAAQGVEILAPNAPGAEKASAAVSAVAGSLSRSANANVAAIAQQVNIIVALLNLFGIFKHKAPAA